MHTMHGHGNSLWQLLRQPALFACIALAMHSPAQADTIQHTVAPGDHLYNLAEHYLGTPHAWPELQAINHLANPHRLQPGTIVLIPNISSSANASFAYGEVALVDEAGNTLKPIVQGDSLPEGSRVRTGNNSYLSLEFTDGTVARILSNTNIRLDRIRENSATKQSQRIIYLEQGNTDISVTPAAKRTPNHFKVITPQAVAAVRGTRFTVNADGASATSVTQGKVQVQQPITGKRKPEAQLEAGQGIAVTEDGLGKVQTLLAAPDLSQLPVAFAEPELLQFDWPGLDNSREYQYRIAQDEDMQKILWNASSNSASATLPSLQDGEYLLAVRALDLQGISGYEAQHRFTIHSHPSSPWLLFPQPEQTIGSNSTLSCTPVAGAQAYHLQIASDSEFQQVIVDVDNLHQCRYQLDSLAAGKYYWRVASLANDTAGNLNHGPYSQPVNITVSETESASTAAIPGQAYWISPRQNTRYVAQVSHSAQFDALVTEQQLDKSEIDLQALPAGRYYVRLATLLGNESGPFSDARIIEIEQQDNRGFDRTWFDKPKP